MTTLTQQMRLKYQRRTLANGIERLPPGGNDVLLLCDHAEALERIIREIQTKLTTAEQNEVERRLWNL